MTMPEYLFFAEDKLVPAMATVLDIMDIAMYMPKTWITHIDK